MIRIGRYLFVQLQLLSGFRRHRQQPGGRRRHRGRHRRRREPAAARHPGDQAHGYESGDAVRVRPRPGPAARRLRRALRASSTAASTRSIRSSSATAASRSPSRRSAATCSTWCGTDPLTRTRSLSDAGFNTSLVSWSAVTGHTTGTLFSPGGFSIADVERNDRGELYVCDNDLTGFPASTSSPPTPTRCSPARSTPVCRRRG